MNRVTHCPHCGQTVTVPAGLSGRKRVQCPLCRNQFGLEISESAVRVLAIDTASLGVATAGPTAARKRQPWQYRFDFGAIFSKTFSHYGSAFLAALVYFLLVFLLLIGVSIGVLVATFVLRLLGWIGAIILFVLLIALLAAAIPLMFGIVSACMSIARGKGWDVACFFQPFRNFGGFIMWYLGLIGLCIAFGVLAVAIIFGVIWLRQNFAAVALIIGGILLLGEGIALVGVLLRCFAISPMFLIDGYGINDAVKWNLKVTSHYKWLYWLVLLLLLFLVGLFNSIVGLALRFTLLAALGPLVGALVGLVASFVLNALVMPLTALPLAVAYVEMMKQIRRKTPRPA
ncbi:hypothetical protein HRbin36_01191 [bacterium HR36]|nr:hypothetical protein HRbin36_01191 [bacterium HR36]